MFCNQCEQTSRGRGCTRHGVCGKTDSVADMQDKLIYALRLLAVSILDARQKNISVTEAGDFLFAALFATITNVNFDGKELYALTRRAVRYRVLLEHGEPVESAAYEQAVTEALNSVQAGAVSPDHFSEDENIRSAMQTLLFGLKGIAAYAHHAACLNRRDPEMLGQFCSLLSAGWRPGSPGTLDGWLELILHCGQCNLRAMELLDAGNTGNFGDPQPTAVSLGHRAGKAILVSGHDLPDLFALLRQTSGTGINVYTHGEMLPAHGYPRLHEFPHLAGHYGTAWQNQRRELPHFPGPVLFTTNCIQNPEGYAEKVFTSGVTGWPGVTHCSGYDFHALINQAQKMEGFPSEEKGKQVLVGFGRKTLLDTSPRLLELIQSGKIRHIFLVGGCDGARPTRNYFNEFVEKTPQDTLILTLACGKFRFFDKDLGKIDDIPRLIDAGQCNDAYSAIRLAQELAQRCNCGINDLPLSFIISWYEQKAVAVLLTLISLGVKNIRLGPSLPAFLSSTVLDTLVRNWNISPVSTPEADIMECMKDPV